MLDTIKGEVRIFTREVEAKDKKGKKITRKIYNACVGGTKQEDDTYLNYYMPVNFSSELQKTVKDIDDDYFDILIKESWIKAYRDKDENVKPILFVNTAKIVK